MGEAETDPRARPFQGSFCGMGRLETDSGILSNEKDEGTSTEVGLREPVTPYDSEVAPGMTISAGISFTSPGPMLE